MIVSTLRQLIKQHRGCAFLSKAKQSKALRYFASGPLFQAFWQPVSIEQSRVNEMHRTDPYPDKPNRHVKVAWPDGNGEHGPNKSPEHGKWNQNESNDRGLFQVLMLVIADSSCRGWVLTQVDWVGNHLIFLCGVFRSQK